MTTPTIFAIGWALLLGGAGGLLTDIGQWYRDLRKPSWQPPDWLFGPAWTVILGLAAWAAVLAWDGAADAADKISIAIVYAVNFIFHLAWSPLFFKAKRPDWSLVEVMFLWASIMAMMIVLSPLSETAGWMILPYLLWVSFAAYLNLTIVRLNGPFARV